MYTFETPTHGSSIICTVIITATRWARYCIKKQQLLSTFILLLLQCNILLSKYWLTKKQCLTILGKAIPELKQRLPLDVSSKNAANKWKGKTWKTRVFSMNGRKWQTWPLALLIHYSWLLKIACIVYLQNLLVTINLETPQN